MFQENVLLAQHSNYKIGGRARYFLEVLKIDDLILAVNKARLERLPVFVLGGGTNILFSDEGFDGLVIKPMFNDIQQSDSSIRVGSGTLMSNLVNFTIQQSLSGLEWAGGLPGTVGGAIRGNAGAFGGETKDNIMEVTSLNISGKEPLIIKRDNQQCQFQYRDSILKKRDGLEIIISATFKLIPGYQESIKAAVADKITWRANRQPLEYPNIGSIFKNVDWQTVPEALKKDEAFKSHLKTDPFLVIPAAYLIDQCGLKGLSHGGAEVSQKHPNFIINKSQASAQDVKKLIKLVKAAVHQQFGITLEEEVLIF